MEETNNEWTINKNDDYDYNFDEKESSEEDIEPEEDNELSEEDVKKEKTSLCVVGLSEEVKKNFFNILDIKDIQNKRIGNKDCNIYLNKKYPFNILYTDAKLYNIHEEIILNNKIFLIMFNYNVPKLEVIELIENIIKKKKEKKNKKVENDYDCLFFLLQLPKIKDKSVIIQKDIENIITGLNIKYNDQNYLFVDGGYIFNDKNRKEKFIEKLKIFYDKAEEEKLISGNDVNSDYNKPRNCCKLC